MGYFKFLPDGITLEILTRLPTESVLESKLVCTNWRNIISNHPSFSEMHFHHHLNHPSGKLGFLVFTCSRIYGQGLHYLDYNQNHDESTTPIQIITRINMTTSFRIFRFLGSVNGLICLLAQRQRFLYVCICNPITGENVTLPEINRDSYTDGYTHVENSFGYVSSTNKYKIIRFYKLETCLQVHIYTLGSGNGWRNLGKFNYGSTSLYLHHMIFFANGALYWVDDEMKMIGTFDLAEEKFGEYLSPPNLPPDTNWKNYCQIGVLDGHLFFALLDEQDVFYYDIWLLKEKIHNHDKEDAGELHQSFVWNKEFKIGDRDLLGVPKSGCVFTHGGNYLNIYNTNLSTSKRLVKFTSYILGVSPHKNTLVSLNELGEEDTKLMESAKIEETESSEQL